MYNKAIIMEIRDINNRQYALDDLSNHKIASLEFTDFILGKYLGRGIDRIVFEYKPNPKYVIKIDIGNSQANSIEWNNWLTVKYTKYEKWFAPIKEISPCGRILLMEKVKTDGNYSPKRVPVFMADLHDGNWGLLKGKPVCIDYAITNFHLGLSNQTKKFPRWVVKED